MVRINKTEDLGLRRTVKYCDQYMHNQANKYNFYNNLVVYCIILCCIIL